MIQTHLRQYPNASIYRATGPSEHWITAVEKMVWGVESKHVALHRGLKQGDILIFHSMQSAFTGLFGVIGFGIINGIKVKEDYWWKWEFENNENRWPNVVLFKEMFLLGDRARINIDKPIQEKSDEEIRNEVSALLNNSISLLLGWP